MMRIEIGIKMDRLAEILVRSPNRLEDIRDLCLELATDIDQYIQEVEEERFDTYDEDEENEDENEDLYDIEEDERYQEYQYRYGDADEKY
jgi:hypothetical protein